MLKINEINPSSTTVPLEPRNTFAAIIEKLSVMTDIALTAAATSVVSLCLITCTGLAGASLYMMHRDVTHRDVTHRTTNWTDLAKATQAGIVVGAVCIFQVHFFPISSKKDAKVQESVKEFSMNYQIPQKATPRDLETIATEASQLFSREFDLWLEDISSDKYKSEQIQHSKNRDWGMLIGSVGAIGLALLKSAQWAELMWDPMGRRALGKCSY
jgi:hypothetical protein